MAQAKKSKKKSPPKSKSKLKSKVKKNAKLAVKKSAVKKSAAKKTVMKKPPVKKPAAKKTATKLTAKPIRNERAVSARMDSLTPLDDRVIVAVSAPPTKTEGGLYIPASSSADRPNRGKVLAVGRGHLDKKGRLRPMAVKAGDEVLFAAFSGTEMKIKERDVIILREADVLGVLD